MRKERRTILRKKLFQRDGWYAIDETTGHKIWYALCAFDCGTRLTPDTATIDHYPIPARAGGRFILSNTRLACKHCNTTDGGLVGGANMVMPPNLTKQQKRAWWRKQHAELNAVSSVRGDQPGRKVG